MKLPRTVLFAGAAALSAASLAHAGLPRRDIPRCGAGLPVSRPFRPTEPLQAVPAPDASRAWQELRDLRERKADPEAVRAKLLEIFRQIDAGTPRTPDGAK